MPDDLVLIPEVEARRLLGDRRMRMVMVAPIGAWYGRGRLRVLRIRERDGGEVLELFAGYDSYERANGDGSPERIAS